MEYKTCFEGCTKLAAEPGAPVDLDAIGESAVPTPPQPDESDTKSLTRRVRQPSSLPRYPVTLTHLPNADERPFMVSRAGPWYDMSCTDSDRGCYHRASVT